MRKPILGNLLHLAIAALLAVGVPFHASADLVDCALPSNMREIRLNESLPLERLEIEPSTAGDRSIALVPGKALYVGDVRYVYARQTLVVDKDVQLVGENGLFGPRKIPIRSNQRNFLSRELLNANSEVLYALQLSAGVNPEYLLVDAAGNFCTDRLVMFETAGPRLSKNVSLEGDGVAKISPLVYKAGKYGLRLIYGGQESGLLLFSESWIAESGARIEKKVAVDKYAKSAIVGPLPVSILVDDGENLVAKFTVADPWQLPAKYCIPVSEAPSKQNCPRR